MVEILGSCLDVRSDGKLYCQEIQVSGSRPQTREFSFRLLDPREPLGSLGATGVPAGVYLLLAHSILLRMIFLAVIDSANLHIINISVWKTCRCLCSVDA